MLNINVRKRDSYVCYTYTFKKYSKVTSDELKIKVHIIYAEK